MNLSIQFGALAPDIKRQLPPGVVMADGDLEHFQRDADSITRLSVRGLITDAAKNAARQKLMERIVKAVREAA